MTVVSIKTNTSKAGPVICRIGLSDGVLFSYNPVYLPRPFQGGDYFFLDKELSEEEVSGLRFAADCFRAERASLRLTARAEQNAAGLSRKLEQRGYGAACIKAAVAYLRELEIVDDRRFAERWIQSRLYRGTDSPLRLISGLCRRGIDRDTARAACKAVLDFEQETALLKRFIEKKYPTAESQDRFLRGKLKGEGFSPQALEWLWETWEELNR
jgi:regulatory protein